MLFVLLLRAILNSQASLAIENLALRQQVAVLKRSVPRLLPLVLPRAHASGR